MPSKDHCWRGGEGVASARTQSGVSADKISASAARTGLSISGLRHRRSGTAEPRPAAALQHRGGDADGQRSRPLKLADQGKEDQKVHKVDRKSVGRERV